MKSKTNDKAARLEEIEQAAIEKLLGDCAFETTEEASIFPMMGLEPLEMLAYDIQRNGLQDPIVITPDLRLIDGRNRVAAIQLINNGFRQRDMMVQDGTTLKEQHALYGSDRHDALFGRDPGAKVVVVHDPETSDSLSISLSANIHRRHLSGTQKADLYVRVRNIMGVRKQGGSQPKGSNEPLTSADYGQLLGLSLATIKRLEAKVKRLDPLTKRPEPVQTNRTTSDEVIDFTRTLNSAISEADRRDEEANPKTDDAAEESAPEDEEDPPMEPDEVAAGLADIIRRSKANPKAVLRALMKLYPETADRGDAAMDGG